ncbi:tyrosine-type recombinase/integrase [Mesorhizobium sp. M0701]|uniref:tyrosine-type recombinase/integrase n=1 Tax=Mesorhizobium sp. M0701 TaxID=2956989 RepID=UPI00333BD4C5
MSLLHEPGAALAAHVLHARPEVEVGGFFFCPKFRQSPFECAASISESVQSRFEQSGLELPRMAGAHPVRHSLATQLVWKRRPINGVADLLGHRSIDATAI